MSEDLERQELAPELEEIRARAAAADGAAQPLPPEQAQAQAGGAAAASTAEPEAPFAKRLAGDMLAIGNMLAMRFPSLKVVYTPENCTRSADDIAPALEKLGWTYPADTGGMMYARAAGAVLMMGMATRDAILFDVAKEKQLAAASGGSAAQSNDRSTDSPADAEPVAPGAQVHDQVRLYQ